MRERGNLVVDSASHYTEVRYGLRLRTLVGMAAACAAIVAWPVLRHFRRRRP